MIQITLAKGIQAKKPTNISIIGDVQKKQIHTYKEVNCWRLGKLRMPTIVYISCWRYANVLELMVILLIKNIISSPIFYFALFTAMKKPNCKFSTYCMKHYLYPNFILIVLPFHLFKQINLIKVPQITMLLF